MTIIVLCITLLHLSKNNGLLVHATDSDFTEDQNSVNRELDFLKHIRQRTEALMNWPKGSPPADYDLEKLRFPQPATVPKKSHVDWLGREIDRLSGPEITPEDVDGLKNKATDFQRVVNDKRLKELFTFSESRRQHDTDFAMAPSDPNFYNTDFIKNEIPEHPLPNKKPKVKPDTPGATQDPGRIFEDLRRHRQNPQGNVRQKSIVNTAGEGSSLGGQDEPQPKSRQFHVIHRQTSNESLYLVAIVAGAAATITVCVVGVVVGWYKKRT